MAVRIRWNNQGFYDLRRAPGVVALEEEIASRIADNLNGRGRGTYATSSQQGARRPQGRHRTTVITADHRAAIDNAKHNTLIRTLGGAL